MKMTYAAIHGGSRIPWVFRALAQKLLILKLSQFIFLAEAFTGVGHNLYPRHKWHGKSLESSCIFTQSLNVGAPSP